MIFILGLVLLGLLAAVVAVAPLAMRRRHGEALLAGVFVVGLAAAIYLLIGRPDLALNPPQPPAPENAAEVEAMVEQLAERLEQAPDDPQGWMMLGRAYVLMGRYDDAARVFNEAVSRTTGEDADLIASLAEARVLGNPAALQGEAGALFERVLTLDASNPRGLWYGGLAAQSRGEEELALARFRQLLERDLPPDFREVVESRVASIDPAALGAFLSVRIDIVSGLAQHVTPDSVLFVFLREVDGNEQGPPLAARKLAFFDFPETVPLTENDLLQGGKLRDVEYLVTARLSADGDPIADSGDIEGTISWKPGNTSSVRVTLDAQRGE